MNDLFSLVILPLLLERVEKERRKKKKKKKKKKKGKKKEREKRGPLLLVELLSLQVQKYPGKGKRN